MKNNGGVAWSPILGQGNFHRASRFGKVSWGGAPVPGPAAAAPSASGPETAALVPGDGGAMVGIVRPRFPLHGPPIRLQQR